MKKLFILIALGSVSLLSADQYYQSYGNPDNGQYYQNEPGRVDYYYGNQRQVSYPQANGQYRSEQQNQYQPSNQFNSSQYQQGYNQAQPNTYGGPVFRNDQGNVSDTQITKQIHDELSAGWFSKGFQDVAFDVNNGIVTLKGFVDKPQDKMTVENDVRKINGVKQIYNNITVRGTTRSESSFNDNQNSNQDFNSRSTSNLNTNPNSTSRYDVQIDSSANTAPAIRSDSNLNANANINLKNSERTDTTKLSESELQKSEKKFPQDTAGTAEDRQINAKIRSKLSGWFSKGYEDIAINTNNGDVSITGTVPKTSDIQKINEKVREVEGVKSLNNQTTAQK